MPSRSELSLRDGHPFDMLTGFWPVQVRAQVFRAVAEPLPAIEALDEDLLVAVNAAFHEDPVLTVIFHPASLIWWWVVG